MRALHKTVSLSRSLTFDAMSEGDPERDGPNLKQGGASIAKKREGEKRF
jgi:hypothetical protein